MSVAGSRILQRRKALKMSQEVLAGLAGIDQTQISKYELGKNEPGAEAIAAIARALDTTADWLLGLTDAAERPLRGQSDLTEDERQLVELYRQKAPEVRRKVLDVAKVL